MASTFTLNFCLSGIQGYGWGSFNQPGLLNFGVFSVSTFILINPFEIYDFDITRLFGVIRSLGFFCQFLQGVKLKKISLQQLFI